MSLRQCSPMAVSYLEECGIACIIINGKMEGLSVDEVAKTVVERQPDIILAGAIAERIKEALPEMPVVIGGPHATAIPEETLKECPAVDFVITGKREETLVELLRGIESDSGFQNKNGLGLRDGERL